MPRDERVYITVHNGMPDHPKIAGLSDGAFRLLMKAWCWCSLNETDGRIRAAVWKKMGTPKARKELLAELADDHGDYIEMHDYLEHQRSAAEIEALRDKRRAAGSLGGKAKASAMAFAKASATASATADAKQSAKQNAGKSLAETELRDNSTTSLGSPTVPAGAVPQVVRVYVEACREAGVPAPEEAQARVERSGRSLLAQGYELAAVTNAARNAAAGGWTDLSTQMQRDASRASPATNGRPSTADQRFQAGLDLAAQLERKALP